MRLSLALVAAIAAGCPPPAGAPDAGPVDAGNPPSGVDPSTYCESIVDLFCPFYLRCGRMAVADVAACRPVFLEACNARFEPSFVSLANAGLLELSQDGIDACRAHLDAVPCEQQILDLDGPCASMWVGHQPAAAACGFDVETFVCAPGTACTVDLTLCGTCERVVDDGAGCSASGVTCGHESACVNGACVARKRVGDACDANDRCVLGAVCANTVCAGPAYAALGGACDVDNRCPYFSSCVGGQCLQNAELGAACAADTACDSGFCSVDTCVELVGQGGACTAGAQCQTASCSPDTRACASLPSACLTQP